MATPLGPYTPIVRSDDWLVVSGQLGLLDGDLVPGIDGQVRQAIANLQALLEGEGASLQDVVKTTVFLRHLGTDYGPMNDAYIDAFGGHRPARSAIGVAELPRGALVEVEAWARVRA
jgi:2-iminobutanoate/2-iminopropanoate deaminase